MIKEDFLLDLEHSLSGKGYNTTRSNVRYRQRYHGKNVFLSNEEMKFNVYLSDYSDDEVLLSAIETENCYIDTYKDSFIISDYDSVEELADEILEVVNAYAGTDTKQQKFINKFIKSMNRHGCRRVEAGYHHIFFTYKGIDWEIDPDYSQEPDGIWCFKNIYSYYHTCEDLSSWILKFDLEKWDVKDLVERILYFIDYYVG